MSPENITFDKELLNESKEQKFQDFHNLMSFRIHDIILVSSMYDFYLFEEDGRLYELIRKEYQGLNLSNSPELVHVSSGKEALKLARNKGRFNLIITTLHVEDMSAVKLAQNIKKAKIGIPIALLGYDNNEMVEILKSEEAGIFDKVFIWQGDFRILFGIIKYFEDKMNVESDTKGVGVQVIILIEDSVRFYSSFLPLVYTEVVKQAQRLTADGINLSHRFLKMRARPKIILCSNYDEAWKYYKKYENNILGIISDVAYKKGGLLNRKAGILFARRVKNVRPDLPILLQSNDEKNRKYAHNLGASFLFKNSATLLEDLRIFMNEQFSFGDFIFRLPSGEEVGRASNLVELSDKLFSVPDDSISYHSSRNHFSNWLKSRTDFWLAYKLRPRKVDHYRSIDALREDLIDAIQNYNRERQSGVISDFDRKTFNKLSYFARIGGGSIGGKARGLGFFNSLLSNFNIDNKFKDVKIYVPTTVVLATDIFDQFMEENDLTNFALKCEDDEQIRRAFIDAPKFPYKAIKNLNNFLIVINEPLAVRSSSLLEDSQGQPFAGVYDTLMLPNNNENPEIRLRRLVRAIKQIYASIFYQRAKQYMNVTSYHLEEEKMAVIVQEMVGAVHNEKFYPEISGVAKSYNFYPVEPLQPEDGIVSAAFGLGKTIVEGGNSIRFCPRYPQNIMQQTLVDDILKYNQDKYFALCMNKGWKDTTEMDESLVEEHYVDEAENDNTLVHVGSTYSFENHSVYDGTSREGKKLFTLAPILKYKTFPLPEILDVVLKMSSWGMGNPVEIEFAVNLSVPKNKPKELAVVQMRPLAVSTELEELDLEGYEDDDLICTSNFVMGNGSNNRIKDIIFVHKDEYDRSQSRETAIDIGYFNKKLVKKEKEYLLIGVGRWGTLDPWLGIPITWEQISGAKAIVETNFKDFDVEPSQGSHFFQNLTSFKVGYFTIHRNIGNGFVDWDWLSTQNVKEKKGCVTHVTLESPITIKIKGRENKGVIIKPSELI
ncbi:MAG: histidine kinase [Melioribacteraceae bacterium]|jgi:CheY-like chemotaxis protein|nr:histidine kinase [Melioribacteraceae bacterium]